MMFRRGILTILLGLCGLPGFAGCQSSNGAGKGESISPSFGMDPVPRQTEPDIEGVAVTRTVPPAQLEDGDDEDEESTSSSAQQNNLLTKLIPGRDKGKGRPERKALPVSERSAASDDLDDLDF